jgi:hypothetical protein
MASFGNRPSGRQERSLRDESWKHEFRLINGESAIIRVKTGDGEPYIYKVHRDINQGKGICGSTHNQRCLKCELSDRLEMNRAARKAQILSPGRERAVFTIYSTRVVFKVPQQNNGKVSEKSEIARVNDAGNVLLMHELPDGKMRVEATNTPNHPYSGRYQWAYEGLKYFDLSTADKYAAGLYELDEKLSKHCVCHTKVGDGHLAHDALIIDTVNGPQCEANCGNPRRDCIANRFVRVTREGEDLEIKYKFEALAATAMTSEIATAFANYTQTLPHQRDIWSFDAEHDKRTVLSLSPRVYQFGIDVNALVSGVSAPMSLGAPPPAFNGFQGGAPAMFAPAPVFGSAPIAGAGPASAQPPASTLPPTAPPVAAPTPPDSDDLPPAI